MRRLTALLLLSLIGTFLGLAAWDDCELGEEECPPACHLACVDGCGVVTPPEEIAPLASLVALEALQPDQGNSFSLFPPLPEHSPPRS